MGLIKFGWLVVWVLSLEWFRRKLEVCDVCQELR